MSLRYSSWPVQWRRDHEYRAEYRADGAIEAERMAPPPATTVMFATLVFH